MVDDHICKRQLDVCTSSKIAPEIQKKVTNKENNHKASLCYLDRSQFHILIVIFIDVLIATLVLCLGSIAFIWFMAEVLGDPLNLESNIEIVLSCIFIATVISFRLIEEMPFKLYDAFVLNKKYEFSKNAARYFVIDHIKRFVVLLAFVIPTAAAIVLVVQRSGQYCFMTILPILIGFLFDKYAPLAEDLLKRFIGKLANSLNFLLAVLYIVGDFKLLAHRNVFFHGLWNSEGISLRNPLKDKENEMELKEKERNIDCTDEDHEVHWDLTHVNMITMPVHFLLMFSTFSYFFSRYEPFSKRFIWKHKKQSVLVALLAIVIYVMESYHVVAKIGMVTLWRGFDYRKSASSERTCGNLIKVYLDNLKFLIYDWTCRHLMLSHRMDRLEELDDSKKTK